MDARVFDEYRKNNTIEKLDESIKKYHKIGANLIADKKNTLVSLYHICKLYFRHGIKNTKSIRFFEYKSIY